jgi:hypothetical protein
VRSTDLFNLDFTSPGMFETIDSQRIVEDAKAKARDVIDALEMAISKGCDDESAWRMLASLYIGIQDIGAYNALEARHEALYGSPSFNVPLRPKAPREPQRKLFEMPARLVKGNLPPLQDVLEACASDEGAALEFSRVRGMDADGMLELAAFFSHLPHGRSRPELPGIDRFIDGLIKAARSSTGSPPMWEVLFAYHRLINDESGFDDLAVKYAEKFGVSPPPFEPLPRI